MSSFLLDGKAVAFQNGQSILGAAHAAGRYIPHLCWHPRFGLHGSCRVCMVNADGRNVAACSFPAREGQEVLSRSAELDAMRLAVTRMLFVEGNHFCPACERSGDCTLQALAYHTGMSDPHFPQRFPHREVDASHPEVWLDRDRCILCALCVRASREADGKNVFEISGRGLQARLVVNSPGGRLGETDISAGDAAVAVCPVGALLPRGGAYATPIGQRRFDLTPLDASDPEC